MANSKPAFETEERNKFVSANGTAATYLNFVDSVVVFVAAGKVIIFYAFYCCPSFKAEDNKVNNEGNTFYLLVQLFGK